MCLNCNLKTAEVAGIWKRLIEHLGVEEERRPYCAQWTDLRKGEFHYIVWNGRPLSHIFNLFSAAANEQPEVDKDLVPCDKVREMLDSPLGFDEALQLYLYSKAIRSL